MTDKQVELLRRMFAFVANPPEVKLDRDDALAFDEPVILIANGNWSIRDDKVDGPPSILGTKQVDGFVLDIATYRGATHWQPEEHDFAEVYTDFRFIEVARRAVQEFVAWQISNMLDEDSWAAYAAELEQEKQELALAQQKGHDAYADATTKAEEVNPYPKGIAHWHAWMKGWNAADYQELLKQQPPRT